MPTRANPLLPPQPEPEKRAIYAVVGSRGDCSGPLTKGQAERECQRLTEQSDAQHAERLREGYSAHVAAELQPPETYEVVELDPQDRLAHAVRMARGDAGLGDEETG